MPLISRILIALASLLITLPASTTAASFPSNTTASTTLFKRASVGYTERGVPASVYGTDFAFQNGRFVGDLPPVPPMSIGKCGPAFVPSNPSFFVAMNARAFDTAGCGLCARVSSQGRTTVGPIVDVCASCGDGIKVSLAMLGELAGGQDAARRRGKQQGRSSAARDKNGVLYGFENGRSCVFV
ncbi:hypothetical protein BC831DRAFT_514581 [Entophlyctis helioformis]|nr:hypothetical protein BC831DRAFT_514581 [Entophlyctis helioformis]